MGTNYNGDGTIPAATSGYNPLSISSSTNATPIEITFGGAHGYATGDTVAIEGHLVNTSANGLWVATVTSATKITLNGSVGVGVGGATGYAVDYAINPLWTLPSGGDPRNASSVSSPLEAAANLAPFMYKRVGQYSLYNIGRIAHVDTIDSSAWSTTSVASGGSTDWHALTSASWAYQWSTGRSVNIYNTDILVLKFQTLARLNFATVTGSGLAFGANFNGAGTALVTGSATGWDAAFTGAATLETVLYASDFTATQINSVTFQILAANTNVGAQTVELLNPYHLNVMHYRINT